MAFESFPIEAGHVLAFARAVGDPNPVFVDADAAANAGLAGVAAPPTFVQAGAQFDPDYALRPRPDVPWFGSGSGPGFANSNGGGLHAEQHFEYHRPLLVGDVLTASSTEGRTWEKTGRRGGRLTFFERVTVYRDASGEPVVTARLVGVTTEKTGQGDA